MNKYEYQCFKATCLYQKDTPYQDRSAYDEFNKKIQKYLHRKDCIDLYLNPSRNINSYKFHYYYIDRFFIQRMHILYLFILVRKSYKENNFKDSILSRVIKIESTSGMFSPFFNDELKFYSLAKRIDHYAYDISDDDCFIYYSPETETFLYESYEKQNCYGEFRINAVAFNKDYRLPLPFTWAITKADGTYAIPHPIGFDVCQCSRTLTGILGEDKDTYSFKYSENAYYSRELIPPKDNPYSLWPNFYKHFGDFNIYDFKKIIKKASYEVHPFDDSSFEKVNSNPVLQRLLCRVNKYPEGHIRYGAYSFYSKGDELNKEKMTKVFSKINKPDMVTAMLFLDLRISLGDMCGEERYVNAPFTNPNALGDLWNLKLGTDMIIYHPLLKEAALIDGWEKKICVFKLD